MSLSPLASFSRHPSRTRSAVRFSRAASMVSLLAIRLTKELTDSQRIWSQVNPSSFRRLFFVSFRSFTSTSISFPLPILTLNLGSFGSLISNVPGVSPLSFFPFVMVPLITPVGLPPDPDPSVGTAVGALVGVLVGASVPGFLVTGFLVVTKHLALHSCSPFTGSSSSSQSSGLSKSSQCSHYASSGSWLQNSSFSHLQTDPVTGFTVPGFAVPGFAVEAKHRIMHSCAPFLGRPSSMQCSGSSKSSHDSHSSPSSLWLQNSPFAQSQPPVGAGF